jgi:heme oxygenase
MSGELDLAAYTAYLAQYAYVYQALESRPPRSDDPAPLWNGARGEGPLDRMAAIDSDLRELGASDWRRAHPPLAATAAYVERIESLEPADVARYLAHHYTRYLGDLSGGQAIAKLVARHYGASESQLGFYRFEGIDSPVRFKRAYREAIDALDFTDDQERALLDEAQVAFALNSAIFDALDAHVTASAR